MVRRQRLEIYMDVLKLLKSGEKKPTRIMYKANLSYLSLKDTLKTLLDGEFITVKKVGTSKEYYISAKGIRALEFHESSKKFLPSVRSEVEF